MSDQNSQPEPGEQDVELESVMERLGQIDPTQLGDKSPEEMQQLLGGAKLGEVVAAFQQMAAELAQQQGIDLNQLDDDDEDDDDLSDWFGEDHEESFDEAIFARPAEPDGACDKYPGAGELWQAAIALQEDERLEVSIEMKSPPVTRVEKLYYNTCHYRLVFDLFDNKVTFRDVTTPRQDYLHGHGWPAMLSLPRHTWPEMEVLLDTIQVEQFNLREAIQSNNAQRVVREDLIPIARKVLSAALMG